MLTRIRNILKVLNVSKSKIAGKNANSLKFIGLHNEIFRVRNYTLAQRTSPVIRNSIMAKNSEKQNSYSMHIPFKPMKKNLLISSEAEKSPKTGYF